MVNHEPLTDRCASLSTIGPHLRCELTAAHEGRHEAHVPEGLYWWNTAAARLTGAVITTCVRCAAELEIPEDEVGDIHWCEDCKETARRKRDQRQQRIAS